MPREETSSHEWPNSELAETLRGMRRNWIERGSAESERGCKLTKDLSAAQSVPDAFAACQDLSKEMDARTEDARQLVSDGQKLMDSSARFLTTRADSDRFYAYPACLK
jgi:hypothetical protein